MEITGFATEVVAAGFDRTPLVRFVQYVSAMWPDGLSGDTSVAALEIGDWPAATEEYSEVVPFSRDAAMEEFWEDHGYALMPDGQGPIAVLYRRRSWLSWNVAVLRDHTEPAAPRPGHLDERRLFVRNGVTFTVVTPEDPSEDGFSRRIVDAFFACFAEAGNEPTTQPINHELTTEGRPSV